VRGTDRGGLGLAVRKVDLGCSRQKEVTFSLLVCHFVRFLASTEFGIMQYLALYYFSVVHNWVMLIGFGGN
jgi:hypothetical protein